jgi:tetratricopeptide (TPR) repeat protein
MSTVKKRSSASRKQPGQEIESIANMVSSFLSANRKIITIITAGLAAVIIIVSAYTVKRSMDEQHAAPLLASAYEVYMRANGSSAEYARALELFRAVQKKYPSSLSGAIAAYHAGNCLMSLGRNEESLKEYQAFVKEHENKKLLLGLVYQRMGYVYRELGRQAEAIKSFEQADMLTGPGVATIELARLYEASGNGPESQKKYKTVADKLPGTSWAAEAMGKVRKIEPQPQPGTQPAGKIKLP